MRNWWTAVGVGALATVIAEVVTHDPSHNLFPWHAVPGFDLAYGAAGCVAIVILSKALGKAWLQKDEEDGAQP